MTIETTAPRKTGAKRATGAKTGARAGAAKAAAAGAPDAPEGAASEDAALRKKGLIDRVVETSGVKRKDAKAAMEATLLELGKAIAAGEDLNLQGFGKLKVNRKQEQANGTIYICKLRQPKPGAEGASDADDGLADTDD